MVPFVSRMFDWGAVLATFGSVLSVVPRHCARLTSFLHPKVTDRSAVAALVARRLSRWAHTTHTPYIAPGAVATLGVAVAPAPCGEHLPWWMGSTGGGDTAVPLE
uniref:Uncharacterized protein n=1 Tax=Eutreptiella gymnastica TaxID=73025 RepID=A0A6T2CA13_9EUGL